ncbi:MAG: hypothetical protein JXQ90_13390 [Cyclobacteriaceae bacterium]
MKKTIIYCTAIVIGFISVSQDIKKPQTLVGGNYESISAYGGFKNGFTTIDGELALTSGGEGALLINNSFLIGGYGMGLTDEKHPISLDHPDYGTINYYTSFGHGGILLGFIVKTNSVIHPKISSKIGWGNVAIRSDIGFPDPTDTYPRNVNDGFFLVNPQVDLEVNITHWFRINVGGGYQLVQGVNNHTYSSNDFTGMNYELSFLFGWFR